jgi:hypothetical protein
MAEIKIIRFTRPHLPYQTGEVAGFYPELARNYVAKGVAEDVEPDAPAAAAEPGPPKTAQTKTKAKHGDTDTVAGLDSH